MTMKDGILRRTEVKIDANIIFVFKLLDFVRLLERIPESVTICNRFTPFDGLPCQP
jgi:hypothetical protein